MARSTSILTLALSFERDPAERAVDRYSMPIRQFLRKRLLAHATRLQVRWGTR